jgi:glucose/arabinose dehydrogenase
MRAAVLGVALTLALAAPASAAPSLVKIGDFSQPVHVASPPNDPRVFVVEKGGLVKIVGAGTFLDARSLTDATDEERGLLSIAFPPDYASTGRFYAYLTARSDGSLRVMEFQRTADPNTASLSSGRIVLSIPHPGESNHNGGQLQFGPDGYLYVGTGDGGSAGDPGNDGQRTDSELGKILRIVANTGASAPGNPFGTRVWSYGLRNPWRFTFDRAAPHDLLIGDVGQDDWEEMDWARAPGRGAGVNFGWACREGKVAYSNPPGACASNPVDATFVRQHPTYQAIIGGYVVRDPGLPTLNGRYLYGDAAVGHLHSTRLGVDDDREEPLAISALSSFGEDACGRIYAASLNGPVYRVQDGAPSACNLQAPGGADTMAPAVKVRLAGMKKALKTRRLLVRMRCSEACRAAIGTRLKKVRRLATRHRSLAANKRKTIKLKLSKAVVRKVKRRRFVRVRVTVRATDAAGNTRTVHRRGRLKRR